MHDRFVKAIGKDYMTSFSIENVNEGSYHVMAELINLTMIHFIRPDNGLIHPDDGLSEIKFSNFSEAVGNLDDCVLAQYVEVSKKLTKLTVSNMHRASE